MKSNLSMDRRNKTIQFLILNQQKIKAKSKQKVILSTNGLNKNNNLKNTKEHNLIFKYKNQKIKES